ncbi:hypothetical protein GNF85_15545 [Clostridium perfringens]|nr:hypothetical protein [Clostridium perfringens]
MNNLNNDSSKFQENSGKLALILTLFSYILSFSSIDGKNIGAILNIGMISTWLSICLLITSIGITTIYNDSKYSFVSKIMDYIGLLIFLVLIFLNK